MIWKNVEIFNAYTTQPREDGALYVRRFPLSCHDEFAVSPYGHGEMGRKIFSYCTTDNFAFDLEVILIAQKLKLKIYEMPAMIVNHRDSKISILKDAPKMVREILQIKKRVKKLNLSR